MKLNGKNIITDKDITVTGGNNPGNTLSDILENYDNNITKLKSEVKWLYKYGGVGGGSGGGGGSINWGIHATLGGRTLVNGSTISLSQEDSTLYSLSISIKNGNGNFSVEYTYDNGKIGRLTLNPENNWKESVTLNLPTNSFINITVSDGSDIKTIETNYVTNPYSFSEIKLVNNLGNEYQNINKDIFISNAITGGLKAKIEYSISVEAVVTYVWEILGKSSEETQIVDKEGSFEIEFPKEYLDNDLSGLYEINCNITVRIPNQELDRISKTANFNLIPETLFLKVAPETGTIYDSVITDDLFNVFSYKTGATISLITRAYCGSNQNRSGIVKYTSYNVSGDIETEIEENGSGNIPIYENQNATIQLQYTSPGWKKIRLICTLNAETYTVEKYIYLIQTETSYNWYKKSAEPNLTSYFRLGDSSHDAISNKLGKGIYKQFQNVDNNLDINILTPTSDSVGDILISLGIQYNEINNTNDPIASFFYIDNGAKKTFCTIYQNKVIIENETIEIFLGKTNSTYYNPTETPNYHLVQILLRHTYLNEGENLDYKQVCIYIDGVLEGAANNWLNYTREISSSTLYPGNYTINLFEVSNFSGWKTRTIHDIDINYYHKTYQIKSNVLEESSVENIDTVILESLYKYDTLNNANISYSIENNLLKLPGSATITQISSCLKVPSLVCRAERILTSYDPEGKTSIFDWMNGSYGEQDSDQSINVGLQTFKCPVTLRWHNKPTGNSSGISFDSNKLITGEKLFGANTEFYLRLQGSSTMRYKSKNFTLGVHNTSGENDTTPLFSPNFKKSDNKTFLPDNAFTLKADVVDSSHSNNTSLGKFINDIYSTSGVDFGANPTGELKDHVKTCLEGFPIILFLEITNELQNKDTEYYYLGIYNFNLGRENYLNLGYVDLNVLNELTSNTQDVDEFNFTSLTIPSSSYTPVSNLIVAEVQGNSPMWDFSQYQDSVLFKVDSISEDNNYMFGDIVFGSGETSTHKNKISNFVKSISSAGNYIFTKIGKNFSNIVDIETGETLSNIAYRTINTVPDCDNQFTRRSDGKLYSLVDRENNSSLNPLRTDSTRFNINLLNSCISITEDSNGNPINPYLDYTTAVYYYTICMAFGLVDSVQKNLNIKTWNGKTFGLYFYDMDTALGISNSGDNTSYYCFSDYWKTDITELLDENGNPILDDNGNVVYKNSGTKIFRDYYPEDSNLPFGYDIPSTYLFAVSKYAASFNKELTSAENIVNLNSPQNIWGEWRKLGGRLETADKFIDNYFVNHLKDIPEVLINLDYRVKYLYSTVGKEFNITDRNCLKGRQVERIRDWLTSRFHILDAYFNLGKETVLIHQVDNNIAYYEPTCSLDTLNKNEDIQILRDIFSPTDKNGNITTLNRSGKLTFRVRARNYTPLIHKHANTIERFLLEDENTTYEISVSYNGNQTSKFGGSEGWTYLDSLNSFIQSLQNKGAFSLFTKRLEYIEGNKGELTGSLNLNIPATEKLILNSPQYSSKVNINDTFYNLGFVDISNSKIELTIDGSSVETLIANNINSKSISLNSCSKLTNISLNGSVIEKFSAMPVWKSAERELDLSNINISELTLQGIGGNLKIKGSNSLRSLTVSDFANITITECPNLEYITSNDSVNAVLNSFTVTGAINLKSIILVSDNLSTINLSGCSKLDTLELRKLSATTNTDLELPKLTYLNLSDTSIKKIIRSTRSGNNWVESVRKDRLYLTDFPNLSEFYIENNQQIEYIQFTTNYNKSFVVNHPLKNCKSLKRVFGNITINTSQCFYNCDNFSIHGYYKNDEGEILLMDPIVGTKVKYNNIEVVDDLGRVIHPRETVGLDNTMVTIAETGKYKMIHQIGEDVTNLTFQGNNNNVLNSAFTNTSCTLFDIYYVFQNLYNASNNLVASSCFYDTHSLKGYGVKFTWNDIVDNSPSRLTFMDWGYKISNAASLLRNRLSNKIRIFTTQEIDGELIGGLLYYLPNVTSLNLFLSGANIYTDNKVFTTSTEDGFTKLTDINYFNVSDFIDGINVLNYNDIFNSSGGGYSTDFLLNCFKSGGNMVLGNLNDLFKYCKNLTNITNVINSLGYINFNKFELKLPNTITKINYSFISSYGIGELNFNNTFREVTNNTLKEINQSFRVSNSITDYINSLGVSSYVDDSIKDASMTISDNFFSKFTALENIGYVATGLDASTSVLSSNFSSFGGTLKKKLANGQFPYNIISHLPNLRGFTGFFRDCDSCNTDGSYNTLSIPGDMFKFNTKLTNISRCFQDFKGIIELTSIQNYSNFTNCSNLNNVSYLFCNSNPSSNKNLVHENNTKLGIISMIPYKFFYHGESVGQDITLYGTNLVIDKMLEGDGWVIDEIASIATYTEENINGDLSNKTVYTYIGINNFIKDSENNIIGFVIDPTIVLNIDTFNNDGVIISSTSQQLGNIENSGIVIESDTITNIKIPNSTISDMTSCFQGQGWILPYDCNGIVQKESNTNYQPYDYVYDPNNKQWYKSSNKCLEKETYMWSYDGNYKLDDDSDYYSLDEDIDFGVVGEIMATTNNKEGLDNEICTKNFFCPPDLLRYCTSNVNITNIFYHTGYTDHYYLQQEDMSNLRNYIRYGITGRICPYLLKPVPKITSLEGFLTYAKRLSHYTLLQRDQNGDIIENSVGDTYLIPKTFFNYTTEVINLTNTFKGLNFPINCKLNVFDSLTKPLILDSTFQYPYFQTNNGIYRFTISGLFINKNILSARGTFTVDVMSDTQTNSGSLIYIPSQYVDFGINFTKSKLPTETDTNNLKVKHVYDGYSRDFITFQGVDLITGESKGEFRNHNENLSASPYNYRTR